MQTLQTNGKSSRLSNYSQHSWTCYGVLGYQPKGESCLVAAGIATKHLPPETAFSRTGAYGNQATI